MVVGAFPIAKLSVLLIKQISKPIANACKERAKSHPFFRTYVCMPPAQFYNWCEVKAKMWILNLGKPVNIPVLSQEMAIELGANLLGEAVIFTIGSALLIVEYNRSSKKEAAKEEKRLQEMEHINNTLKELYYTVQHQQTQLQILERTLQNSKRTGILSKYRELPPLEKPPQSAQMPVEEKPAQPLPSAQHEETMPSPLLQTGTQPHPKLEDSAHCSMQHAIADSHEVHSLSSPYPNSNIIHRSLNYIHMDVLQSPFGRQSEDSIARAPQASVQERTRVHRESSRHTGLIAEALQNMENEMSSIF